MTTYLTIVSACFILVLYEVWADSNNHFRS